MTRTLLISVPEEIIDTPLRVVLLMEPEIFANGDIVVSRTHQLPPHPPREKSVIKIGAEIVHVRVLPKGHPGLKVSDHLRVGCRVRSARK